MADNVIEVSSRIEAKVNLLMERYTALREQYRRVVESERRLVAQVAELQSEVSRLGVENERLTMMRGVAPTPEEAQRSRTLLNGLVREIDRCISELKAC